MIRVGLGSNAGFGELAGFRNEICHGCHSIGLGYRGAYCYLGLTLEAEEHCTKDLGVRRLSWLERHGRYRCRI